MLPLLSFLPIQYFSAFQQPVSSFYQISDSQPGFPDPGGPKQDFRGSEMRFSIVESLLFLDALSFKRTDFYEGLQVLLGLLSKTSNLIIPANITTLQFKLSNACIIISTSRCVFHAENGP